MFSMTHFIRFALSSEQPMKSSQQGTDIIWISYSKILQSSKEWTELRQDQRQGYQVEDRHDSLGRREWEPDPKKREERTKRYNWPFRGRIVRAAVRITQVVPCSGTPGRAGHRAPKPVHTLLLSSASQHRAASILRKPTCIWFTAGRVPR